MTNTNGTYCRTEGAGAADKTNSVTEAEKLSSDLMFLESLDSPNRVNDSPVPSIEETLDILRRA